MSTPGIALDAIKRAFISGRRLALNLNQWHVARKLGVSLETFADWEAGRARPSAKHYLAWLEALGLRENAEGELEWKA